MSDAFTSIATDLIFGADADIWYDAADHSDESAAHRIDRTREAMYAAATILNRDVPAMLAALKLVAGELNQWGDDTLESFNLTKALAAINSTLDAIEPTATEQCDHAFEPDAAMIPTCSKCELEAPA